jgi:hypothetical protein
VAPQTVEEPHNDENPAGSGAFERCAEEDSNLHPVIPDQALNLVTRVSDPSYASISSRSSGFLDVVDVMDDLDVATDVARAAIVRSAARGVRPTSWGPRTDVALRAP